MLVLTVFEPPSPPVVTPPSTGGSSGVVSAGGYSEPTVAPYRDGDMTESTFSYPYMQGAELPALRVPWADGDGFAIDFSSGWTFVMAVGLIGGTAKFTKSSGISGGLGFIDVAWSPNIATDLNTLTPGRYDAQLRAHRTSDSADRIRLGEIIISAGIAE